MVDKHDFKLITISVFIFLYTLFGITIYPNLVNASSCEDYTAVPPFLTTTVQPNVLFMLDNSGSMKNPIYKNGSDSYQVNCAGKAGTGFDATESYYGIFESDKHYMYDYFIPVDTTRYNGDADSKYNITDADGNILIDTSSKGAFVESSCTLGNGNNCWSGNFLNWLTTRRIDAARKVLIGGKVENRSGYDYLNSGTNTWKVVGNNEPDDRSICKQYSGSGSYSPFPDDTKFETVSPAHSGGTKTLYDPYEKVKPQDTTQESVNDIQDKSGNIIGEWGTISALDNTTQTITLNNTYTDPVVIAKPPTRNGSNPSIIRIWDVTSSTFDIRIQEWPYLDGSHIEEEVSYIVIEKGNHTFTGVSGEINLVAGTTTITQSNPISTTPSNNTGWTTIDNLDLATTPVILASVITSGDDLADDSNALTNRIKDISVADGDSYEFKVALQQQEANSGSKTADVHYLAIEPGTFQAGDLLISSGTQEDFSHNPKSFNFSYGSVEGFIADMQTTNDTEPATLRVESFSDSSVELLVEEEQSQDSDPSHSYETIGYLTLGPLPNSFNVALIVDSEPQGLVQDIADKVRTGISFYRYDQEANDNKLYDKEWAHGGTFRLKIPNNPFVNDEDNVDSYRIIDTPVKADTDKIVDAIEHYPLIWGTTPLAENLYEVGRYFSQSSPYYNDKPDINGESTFLVYDSAGSASYHTTDNIWDPYIYTLENQTQKVRCAKSYVIIFTDGEPYRDDYVPSSIIDDYDHDNKSTDCFDTGDKANSCKDNLDDVAYYLRWDQPAQNGDGTWPDPDPRDLRSDLEGNQNIEIYTVAFGSSTIPAILQDTADNGNGEAYAAEDGEELAEVLTKAITSILEKTSAGSSLSVLSERATSGALINQALFFPQKTFSEGSDSYDVNWIGSLNAYWFYNSSTVSNIRENSTDLYDSVNSLYYWGLDIYNDKVLDFIIDEDDGSLKIERYDTVKSGIYYGSADETDGPEQTYPSIDDVKTIFESGDILRQRSVDADPNLLTDSGRRVIYGVTQTGTQEEFVQSKANQFQNQFKITPTDFPECLGSLSVSPTATETSTAASNLISYIRGASDDFTNDANISVKCRSRQVNSSGDIWKLGDIIYSTPKLANYTYQGKDFSLLFTGSNDGMLHAFKVGNLRKDVAGANQAIALCDDSYGACTHSEIGEEAWSFIPQNAMPYLKYLADPDYEHIYTVDLPPYIIKVNGRQILIGGMRFGGANACIDGNDWCGDTTSSLTEDSADNPYQAVPPGATVSNINDVIDDNDKFFVTNPYTPAPTVGQPEKVEQTSIDENVIGMSSYYALDITDPFDPKFLWEFTDPKLGYSYSGPAFITRGVGGTERYYVMFLSGPTNANGRATNGQELTVFILEVDDEFKLQQVYTAGDNLQQNPFSNSNKSFGGRLFTNGVDYNSDGNTDAVFFGANWLTSGEWKGDVYFIAPTDDDPTSVSGTKTTLNWTVKNALNEGKRPITTKIEHGVCYGNHYVYFGSGRWFYKLDTPGKTNQNDTNGLYGIQIDECMQDLVAGGKCNGSFNNSHNTQSGDDHCDSQTSALSSGPITWKYDGLEENSGGDYFMERTVTDPTFYDDKVFFTTMEPSSDLCDFGGRTRIWGFNCRTGHDMWDGCSDAKSDPPAGALLLQLSGGNIEDTQLLKEKFNKEGNKTTDWFTGVPPESGTPFVPFSGKLNGEILLWIER